MNQFELRELIGEIIQLSQSLGKQQEFGNKRIAGEIDDKLQDKVEELVKKFTDITGEEYE